MIAVSDLVRRRVPNVLSLGGIGVAVAVLAFNGTSASGAGVQSALVAAAVGLVLTLPAYIAGALGAGDVKLAVAMGLLTDVRLLVVAFVIAGLLAGLWVLVWLYVRRLLVLSGRMRSVVPPATPMSGARVKPVPFGAALAIGLVATLALGELGRIG